MNAKDIQQRTKAFALRVIKLVDGLSRNRTTEIIGKQLLRCGTSVGANYRAACRAKSTADFIAEMGIVEEEADEVIYWLELLVETGLIGKNDVADLFEEANQLLLLRYLESGPQGKALIEWLIRIPRSEIRNLLGGRMEVEKKLVEMSLSLPLSPVPVANYVPAVRSGNLLFVSGHGPALVKDGKIEYIRGKLGRDLTVEQGYEAAKQVMLNILQSIKGMIGDLDKVRRIVKVLGFVNCTEDFPDQPKVINGASDLLVALYGEGGRHARSAVGMQQLPFGIAVEIEMVVEVE